MIERRRVDHPVRVAIDGPDAAGKTILADEIAAASAARGRGTIRASIDGFHRPRADRYRRGPDSPYGYYEDSFDYEGLRRVLLVPLGPAGSRKYQLSTFDYRSDAPQSTSPLLAPDDAVLVFDGVFLLRPELLDVWDFRVFVAASFDVTLRRALARDAPLMGSTREVERRYRTRYIPGQKLYFATACPEEAADVVVDNSDPACPLLRQQREPAQRSSRSCKCDQARPRA
jgi:uridine kinase